MIVHSSVKNGRIGVDWTNVSKNRHQREVQGGENDYSIH